MHELGIVFHVIDSVEAIAKENQIDEVASVTLELGEVSGVVGEYLSDCWKWAITRTEYLKKSELKIETIPAITLCEECNKTYETVTHGKTCPYCNSEKTHLIQGNEVNILQIEVNEEDKEDE